MPSRPFVFNYNSEHALGSSGAHLMVRASAVARPTQAFDGLGSMVEAAQPAGLDHASHESHSRMDRPTICSRGYQSCPALTHSSAKPPYRRPVLRIRTTVGISHYLSGQWADRFRCSSKRARWHAAPELSIMLGILLYPGASAARLSNRLRQVHVRPDSPAAHLIGRRDDGPAGVRGGRNPGNINRASRSTRESRKLLSSGYISRISRPISAAASRI